MKRVYCFLLIFALVFAIAACHATDENSPLGDGLYPIVTRGSRLTFGRNSKMP